MIFVRYFPQFIVSDNFIIKRSLPAPGDIFGKPGTKVKAFDILGEAKHSRHEQVLPVANELNINPRKIKKYLADNIRPKAEIKRDEVIIQKKILFPPVVKKISSPFDGIIEEIDEEKGEFFLRSLPEKIKLIAGISGCIERVEDKKHVFVRFSGLKIQGVLAKGHKVFGEIKVVKEQEAFEKNALGARILVFLNNVSPINLEKIKALRPQAIIFSHLSKESFNKSQLQNSQINFMLLNGFSNKASSRGDAELFEFLNGKQAFFDVEARSLMVAFKEKPEEIFSLQIRENLLSNEEKDKDDFILIKSGQTVRILFPDFFGAEGKVEEVFENVELESGLKTPAAKVKLIFQDETILAPLQNLLILRK